MVGPRAIALAPTVTLIVLNVTYVYKILKKYDIFNSYNNLINVKDLQRFWRLKW